MPLYGLLLWLMWLGPTTGPTAIDAPVVVEPPVRVSVTVITQPRNRGVTGELVEYDETGLFLLVRGERTRLAWIELTPHSAFTARLRAIDPSDPAAWMSLAEFGRGIGAEREAEEALQRALKLDPELKPEAERIRAIPANLARGPFQPKQDQDNQQAPAGGTELLVEADATSKFQPVTPEQAAIAMAQADKEADRSLHQLGVTMRRLETEHFLIYTDWAPSNDEFLTGSLEQAYRLVSREFDIPLDQNVFVGKLPVYMFASHSTFMRFAREVDGNTSFRITVAGYYRGRSDGMGKLVMSTPSTTQNDGLHIARRKWERTLTHEFAHAFFARYRSNGFVPRWLNEGLAETIAEQVYPRERALEMAREIARTNRSIAPVFDDRVMPGPEMYPVMMTLVQALYREDPQRFVRFIDRLKAGEAAEAVMRDLYGVDYKGLEAAWRMHMMRN